MKIAMLGHKRMPSREGGVEVVVEELATRMAALGHEVTLYSRKGHNVAGSEFDNPLYEQDEYIYKGVRVKQVPTLNIKGLAAFTSSYYAAKAAIADQPDVIHFHAEGPSAMTHMAQKAGIRTVATIHGLDWQRAKWGKIGSAYIKHGERVAARYADEIVVLSQGVQNYFYETYGRRTHFIPNAIDEKQKRPAKLITEKYGLTEDSYVLFLGRLVPEKGVHYLIDAFKSLDTDKRLVIAGGSSDSKSYFDQLQSMASRDSRVLFTGFVMGQELEELYSNCAVFVLPSDLEGMPMSLLEAMAYGRCCLTSNIAECATVISDAGLTFKQGDSIDLRNSLQGLLNNASMKTSLGKKAHQRAISLYNWDSVVNQTLSLYGM